MEISDARVRWACRRGMLEIDWFLIRFFDHFYASLHSEQRTLFYDLLSSEDVELHSWLTGSAEVPEHFSSLIHYIRECCASLPADKPLS